MIFPDPKSVFGRKKPPPSPNYGHSYQGSGTIPSPPALPSPPLARQTTAASRSNGMAVNPRKATPSPSNQFASADPSAYEVLMYIRSRAWLLLSLLHLLLQLHVLE